MDENQLLQQLVAQAKSHPDRSAQRRIALTKLIAKIRQSPSLKKPNNNFNIPNYIDVYNEVLNEVCMEICHRIDSYKPEYPVMAWVNKIFNYRSIDAYNRDQRGGITNIPKNERPNWIELDRPLNSNDTENMYTQISTPHINDDDENILLKELIQTDPEGVFTSRHIQNRPDVTFQKIALMRLEGEQWDEISEKLKTISISTLSRFYQRSIDHFLDYIRKELKY